jgi:signal transduction histidine kinase
MRPRRRRRIGAVLGSIRTRLAVFFFLITLIAVAVVYVYAVPSLQSRLQTQQLKDLGTLARRGFVTGVAHELLADANALARLTQPKMPVAPEFEPGHGRQWERAERRYQEAVRQYAPSVRAYDQTKKEWGAKETAAVAQLNAFTGAYADTLYTFQRTSNGGTGPGQQFVSFPPGTQPSAAVQDAAQSAFTFGKQTSRAASSNLGVVAVPLKQNTTSVLVYSVNFTDVRADVTLIRSRILVAAGIALVVVLLLGVLVARALTVRVLRLERAAQQVAQGDLTAQFEVDSNDELGQLAGALDHMQRQLRQLEEARRRFIATASHELRTPIFSLGGFLELIQDEELDEETRRAFVGQVREQVDRLGRLATGLLDLSRLESGSVQLDPTPTDVGVLSRVVAGEFMPALALHDSKLDLELPELPLRANVDPERVAQLLRILIDNAITHTPPGTPLTIGVANGAGTVKLSVADGGPGIPSDVVGRIFEPFYTAEGTHGAGLGLAIARELAERLSGSLEVSSSDQGTVFTLTLVGAPTPGVE